MLNKVTKYAKGGIYSVKLNLRYIKQKPGLQVHASLAGFSPASVAESENSNSKLQLQHGRSLREFGVS